MAKDPAVLFYYQDFLVGTIFMTDDEVGKYIRILCFQADKGSLTESQILAICKSDTIPETIRAKLLIDDNGKYYQKRMYEEKLKRSEYSESRRKNRNTTNDMINISSTYHEDMEDENENENENSNKKMKSENENDIPVKESLREQKIRLLNQRKQVFEIRVLEFRGVYPDTMLRNFFDYWTEPNKSVSQMRWEMERTWELKRRLRTWADRDKTFVKQDDIITYEELLRRFNTGETDMWQKYEQVTVPGKTKPVWRRRHEKS